MEGTIYTHSTLNINKTTVDIILSYGEHHLIKINKVQYYNNKLLYMVWYMYTILKHITILYMTYYKRKRSIVTRRSRTTIKWKGLHGPNETKEIVPPAYLTIAYSYCQCMIVLKKPSLV